METIQNELNQESNATGINTEKKTFMQAFQQQPNVFLSAKKVSTTTVSAKIKAFWVAKKV